LFLQSDSSILGIAKRNHTEDCKQIKSQQRKREGLESCKDVWKEDERKKDREKRRQPSLCFVKNK
jgi:hypothetical protein